MTFEEFYINAVIDCVDLIEVVSIRLFEEVADAARYRILMHTSIQPNLGFK